ncbi:hypothetical protein F4821DRAFT_257279 [Hypoxylon rubiginosum]|uniref:Uncharacterized protein n=1 Tax=Hypoxylon rubiginosum TaxID=110542 RepID=A0ACC0D8R4_9PEZI|nr:hypothetical protein F4821DRAFT_257279 [Hypoxylon rubiginosum]
MSLPNFLSVFKDEREVYNDLSSSDSDSEETLLKEDSDNIVSPSRKPSLLHRVAVISGRVILILLSVWGLVSLYNTIAGRIAQSHYPSERFAPSLYPSCSCGGTTVAEAKRRGCVFTPLAIAWLPPHCVDMELANDFDKQGPGPNGEWDYWSDMNMTRRLTREEVGYLADVNGVFYATQDWHVTHCVYTWMKHYRSKWTGTTIERRSNGLDHIEHCKDVLKIRGGLQDIRTVAGIALDADDPGRTEL